MQQNLIKIQEELDIIRILSRLSMLASENGSVGSEHFSLIFKDIEERCWKISELVEQNESVI
jgi:hypothetical protein